MRLNKQRKTAIYGYRRLKIYLEQLKINLTEKQIRKIMCDHNLFAKIRRKKFKYVDDKIVNIYEENLINNDYLASNSQEK